MAKKSNRSKKKTAGKPAVTVENDNKPDPVESLSNAPPDVEPHVPRAAKITRSQAAAERIEDEYAYITGDLRRVFILAGAMFALLIVLNIVLGMMQG